MPTPPHPGLGRSTRRRATSRPADHRQNPRPTHRTPSRGRAAIPASVWPPPRPVDPDAAWPEPILERLITTLTAPGDRIALLAPDYSAAELPDPIYGTAARAVVPTGTLAAAAETIEAHDRLPYLAARGSGTGGQHAVPYWARFVHPTPAGSAVHTTTGSGAEPDLEDLGAPPLPGHSQAAGTAALVVAPVAPEGVGEAFGTAAAGLLRPGGTLAVITHCDRDGGRLRDPSGSIVAAAQNADLLYLQHVVALHHPIHGGRIGADRTAAPSRRPSRHSRVHSDVYLFWRCGLDAPAPPADASTSRDAGGSP